MSTTLEVYLGPAQRGNIPSHILELLLRSLSEIEDSWQEPLHSLVPIVSKLAREVTTEPDVRRAALLALARIDPSTSEAAATLRDAHHKNHRPPSTLESTSEVAATLRGALDAVRDGRFADPGDEIAGILLRLLYPQVITPDRIWEYASLMRRGSVGEGWNFWREVLCDETPANELANLLDGFADDAERLRSIISSAFAEQVPRRLLVRALGEIELETEPARIYHWITAVISQVRSNSADELDDLHKWLQNNDETTQQLLRIAIIRSTDNELGMDARLLLRKFLLAACPPRFVEWCAQEARTQAGIDLGVACAFLKAPLRYGHWLEESGDALIERLRSGLANDPQLLDYLNEYLNPSAAQLQAQEEERQHQQELDEIRAEHDKKRQQRQSDWRVALQQSRDEIATNSFPASNLHTLALAYFGRLAHRADLNYPRDRVAELIGDNAELLDAAMHALCNAPLRDDVPTAERTAELSVESKHDWLAYPVLAGLAIREAEGILDLMCFPDGLRRSAIAIYATTLLDQQQRPTWPVKMLNDDPKLVLDVLHMCSVAAIKNGKTHLWIMDWLNDIEGRDDELRDFRMQSPDACLTALASPSIDDELRDFRLQLLRSISVRLPVAQLPIVDRLLQLVSKHPDTAPLKELAAQKLRAASMTNAQRIRWMTLDAIMSGGEALELLDDFIGSNAKRARQLAEFLSLRVFVHPAKLVDRLTGDDPSDTFRGLVGIIGRHFPPREFKSGEVYSVGASEEMSDLVGQWIMDLGGQPTAEAGAALDGLIADERLGTWHSRLEYARNRQQRLQRDTSYAPMNVVDVLALLHNGPPTNVADLHALLIDHLRDLISRIRGNNDDLWRQFWADDHEPQPKKPKRENSCRDALLAMLCNRLPEGVDAQWEGPYTAGRRADIRVAFKDKNIPVEIKRQYHPDLWTAIHDQLTAKYTTDPATGGHGIYLVLWFGSEVISCPPHPKSRDRPSTPAELERRLKESMSHEQRRTISVVVLDVTKP
ncbi:MAG: hypothetical protein KTV16_15740 [Acidimicrobiia bacterium]|nr:hypothetical protein [Acidimicrobiia bacterium]